MQDSGTYTDLIEQAIQTAFRREYTNCAELVEIEKKCNCEVVLLGISMARLLNHTRHAVPDLAQYYACAEARFAKLKKNNPEEIVQLVECAFLFSQFFINLSRKPRNQNILILIRAGEFAKANRLYIAQYSIAGQLTLQYMHEGYLYEAVRFSDLLLHHVRGNENIGDEKNHCVMLVLLDKARIAHNLGIFEKVVEFCTLALAQEQQISSPIRTHLFIKIADAYNNMDDPVRARKALEAAMAGAHYFGSDSQIVSQIENIKMRLAVTQKIDCSDFNAIGSLRRRNLQAYQGASANVNLMTLIRMAELKGQYKVILWLLRNSSMRKSTRFVKSMCIAIKVRALIKLKFYHAALSVLCSQISHTVSKPFSAELNPLFDLYVNDAVIGHTKKSLIRKNREMERAVGAQENYLSALAHDIQSPISVLQMIGAEQEHVDDGILAVERIGNLLDKVDVSNSRISRYDDSKLVRLSEVLNGLHSRFDLLLQSKKLSLGISCDKEIDCVVCLQKLDRILDNLLSNAIKYSPSNGSIIIHVIGVTDSTVEIHVVDSGYGIPKKYQSRVFEQGFVLNQDARKNNQQNGFGLSICKMLVSSMQGRVSVFSNGPDEGSVFTVTLPREGPATS